MLSSIGRNPSSIDLTARLNSKEKLLSQSFTQAWSSMVCRPHHNGRLHRDGIHRKLARFLGTTNIFFFGTEYSVRFDVDAKLISTLFEWLITQATSTWSLGLSHKVSARDRLHPATPVTEGNGLEIFFHTHISSLLLILENLRQDIPASLTFIQTRATQTK